MKDARLICAVVVLAAWAAIGHAEYPHAPPPESDPFLTNRLGRSWGEPIYTGYLIADGRYIDAPYVVEQRGYKIMVNGAQVERIDPRCVLPLPPPEPVTEDPGMPTDLTRDSSVSDAFMHPVTQANRRYWDHLGLEGQARVDTQIAYFKMLPCIADVLDTGQPGISMDTRNIELVDRAGQSKECMIYLKPRTPSPAPPDETIHQWAVKARGCKETSLRGGLVFIRGGTTSAVSGHPDSSPRWRSIFETMAGDLPPEEKVLKLKASGFLHKTDDVRTADNFFAISQFQPTDQLWKRLKGDESWKDDAEERLYALTNGWKRIAPAFEREPQPKTVIEDGPAPTIASAEEHAQQQTSTTAIAPAAPVPPTEADPTQSARPTPIAVRERRGRMPLALTSAAILALIAILILAVRQRRP